MSRVIDWILDHLVIAGICFGSLFVLVIAGIVISEQNCTKHEKRPQVILLWAGNGIFVPVVQEVDVCVEWIKKDTE